MPGETIKKKLYPRNQLTEIYQNTMEPQKQWKEGAPYIIMILIGIFCEYLT